ncbi:MAG TPA: patatin-like phospholipase family protein [Saprospiraceae bacterium]|nr:patatin-like phospholipase family protein [Saprospiraceae bacterium]
MTPIFDNIALCLSGGGFRSAAYALGVLKYLDKVGLRSNIKSISTVSGGSITGIKYIEWLSSDGVNFQTFHDELYQFLAENRLHQTAVSILNDDDIWQDEKYKHKDRNLINSFAIAYDGLLKGKTLQDLNLLGRHLKEYVFNATDMSDALKFRFKNTGVLGNNSFKKKLNGVSSKTLMPKIKLCDVLAASSCFPGGFEPIQFPNDFFVVENNSTLPKVSLMDGGIVSNQGIDNYLIKKKIGKTLLFLADVENYRISNPFEKVISGKFIDVFTKLTSGATTILLALLGTLLLTIYGQHKLVMIGAITLLSISFCLGLLQWLIYYLLKKTGEKIGLKDVLIFHPRRYAVYIINRLTSFKSVAESIFLKNNRRRSLDYLYFKLDTEKGYAPILCPIYRLTSTDQSETRNWAYINAKLVDPYPSKKMLETVGLAASFGTTLWFDDENREAVLNALVKTGEMTACFSLLTYLLSEENEGRLLCSDYPIYEILKTDYKEFQQEV